MIAIIELQEAVVKKVEEMKKDMEIEDRWAVRLGLDGKITFSEYTSIPGLHFSLKRRWGGSPNGRMNDPKNWASQALDSRNSRSWKYSNSKYFAMMELKNLKTKREWRRKSAIKSSEH